MAIHRVGTKRQDDRVDPYPDIEQGWRGGFAVRGSPGRYRLMGVAGGVVLLWYGFWILEPVIEVLWRWWRR